MKAQSDYVRVTLEMFIQSIEANPDAHPHLVDKLKEFFENDQLHDEEFLKNMIENLEVPYES